MPKTPMSPRSLTSCGLTALVVLGVLSSACSSDPVRPGASDAGLDSRPDGMTPDGSLDATGGDATDRDGGMDTFADASVEVFAADSADGLDAPVDTLESGPADAFDAAVDPVVDAVVDPVV